MKKAMSLFLALCLVFAMTAAVADNGTVQTIMNVGTTQAFTTAVVSEADILTIVQAGLAATSAINQQPWYFVVVTNPDVMAEIAGGGMTGAAAGDDASSGDAASAGESAATGDAASAGDAASTGDAASEGDAASAGAPATAGTAKAAMGDSPVAIIIYRNDGTSSPDASFDCGLACQNMVIAAAALGYGTKIVSSPTMTLNGTNHDALCEKLGVDPAFQAVAVLLIGYEDAELDAQTGASVRNTVEEKVSFIK